MLFDERKQLLVPDPCLVPLHSPYKYFLAYILSVFALLQIDSRYLGEMLDQVRQTATQVVFLKWILKTRLG
jgi:hypothetical protein